METERMTALNTPFASEGTPPAPHSLQQSRTTETWRCLITFRRTSMSFASCLPYRLLRSLPEGSCPSSVAPRRASARVSLSPVTLLPTAARTPNHEPAPAAGWQGAAGENSEHLTDRSWTAAGQSCTSGIDPWASGPPSSVPCITLLVNLSNQPCSAVVSCRKEVPKA